MHYAPRKGQPTLLFLHGFPESAYDWRRQFGFFHRLGYGIVAPDLLGYSGTDKPADVQAYSLKNMAREVVELLDCEGVETVVGVGHDLYADSFATFLAGNGADHGAQRLAHPRAPE